MGRSRKPTELKKFEGTYRKDRDNGDSAVSNIIQKSEIILNAEAVSCPKSITDKYCRKYWKTITHNLLSIHLLSAADLPQIEQMILYLQKLREVQVEFMSMSPLEEGFDDIEKKYERLEVRFNSLASKYYVSPQDRAKLKIDELSVLKAEQDIVKNQSAVGKLLGV